MPHPLVSVIVGTHNCAAYIRATLESVFAQTFKDFEVVVVDDASTDHTIEVLKSFGSRIRLTERKANSGSADIPRYEAIEQALGRYCALLDSDDLWTPEKLAKQVAFMESHPDVPLCHTYVRVIDEKSTQFHIRHEGAIPPTGRCAAQLLRHCFISTSSVMVRRAAWLAAQDKSLLRGFGTEWDFFLAIARGNPVGFIPEPLASYRRRSGSVSRDKWKRMPRDVGAKARILGKGLWEGVVSREDMLGILSEALHENWRYWLDRRRWGRSAYFALKAVGLAPRAADNWVMLLKSLARPLVPSWKSESKDE